jgi:dienelactone hydrolase
MPVPLDHLRAALSDRYTIEHEIGRGGMATVYLAHDLKHDRDVALKVLHAEVASTVGRERFLREIQITARLNHPHILTLIDSGEAGDILYYVLPLVDGESLRERLDRDGQLGPSETATLISQIADAVDYAHEQGVLHRDIKPENILLHRGAAMVSDFGIAVGLAAARDERLTETGTSIGTPSYMSPEQIEAETTVDRRSDVYAVGCLAYEMLVGKPPYTGSSQTIFAKILTTDPPDVSEDRPDVPAAICRAVARAQARSPDSRYETVGDFAAALRDGARPDGAAQRAGRSHTLTAILAVAALLVLALFSWRVMAARDAAGSAANALAELDRAVEEHDWIAAWQLVDSFEGRLTDSVVDEVLSEATRFDTITSDPPGASVAWRNFAVADEEWTSLGETPLETRLPNAMIALRLELAGYEPRFASYGPIRFWVPLRGFPWVLQPMNGRLRDVVHVPPQTVMPKYNSAPLGDAPDRDVGDFLIDKFEVTNARYQEFVDAGGYANPDYWDQPVEQDGRILKWAEAMAMFVDRTGRPGPATWEVGAYLAGTENQPVTGVSWYEAMAFARWAGRSLPTLYHWFAAAAPAISWSIVPLSNMNGAGIADVGKFQAVGPYGTYDMPGNAREWVVNSQEGERITLGGGWNDAYFYYHYAHPVPPLNRGQTNGFRLITRLGDTTGQSALAETIPRQYRDFSTEIPVSDEIFDVFRSMYEYDDTPLKPELEAVDTVPAGIRQRISLDTADGDDRIILYLFLPREPVLPLQTVFVWPGSGVLHSVGVEVFDRRSGYVAPLVQSGRAVALAVFKSMWEREDDYEYRLQDASNDHRDHVISWRQDMGRILDYLETRPDIDPDGFSYFGFSWGGRMGAIMLALEPRFRAGVLYVAGLSMQPTQAVVDPFNFASRVTVPVIMLNGRYDQIYPLETQSKPLFDLLGSEEKVHYIADGGHNVPYVDLIRESLRWLDRYVGLVE